MRLAASPSSALSSALTALRLSSTIAVSIVFIQECLLFISWLLNVRGPDAELTAEMHSICGTSSFFYHDYSYLHPGRRRGRRVRRLGYSKAKLRQPACPQFRPS